MKLAILALFVIASASAAEQTKVVATEAPAAEMINKATCTKGAETRELEITAKGDGHTVTYTKSGEAKEISTCSMNKEKCQAVFDNLKANLEKAGFACKI